jgi:hypothetical protein
MILTGFSLFSDFGEIDDAFLSKDITDFDDFLLLLLFSYDFPAC